MPLYEYKCDRCGDVFEVIEKFSDKPLEQHEGCGGHVERLLSAPALQFKGTGWYVTDYANKNSAGKASPKSDDKPASAETKSESKTETKPATPAESKPAEKK